MDALSTLKCILLLFGGLGVFLFGLATMSENLERSASDKLRRIFDKITSKKSSSVLLGAGSTAIIQSSSATTVIVVGFVNAGLITLSQAAPIIMGANIGTTVTALMMSLPISEFIAAFGCVGAFILMFSKNNKVKRIASIIISIGLIFVGLNVMSSSMSPFGSTLEKFFLSASNPIVLLLLGLIFTAIIQSSSAMTGIMLSLASITGVNGLPVINITQIMFVLLGVNVGTCITAYLASIGNTPNARRAALIHILFNIFGACIFFILLIIRPIRNLFITILEVIPQLKMQLAAFHIFFNLVTTIILLPLSNVLVNISQKLIKDKPVSQTEVESFEYKKELKYLNSLIMQAPSIAVAQVKKEILRMSEIASKNLEIAIECITTKSVDRRKEFDSNEEMINFLNHSITEFMVKLTSLDLSLNDETILGSFYHVVSDIERIGDYSDNIVQYTEKMIDENIEFSDSAIAEIKEMYERIRRLDSVVVNCFENENISIMDIVEQIEDSIDECKKNYSAAHIKRLNEGKCTPINGQIFFSLISNMERIADHMTNISHSIKDYAKNPTTKFIGHTKKFNS